MKRSLYEVGNHLVRILGSDGHDFRNVRWRRRRLLAGSFIVELGPAHAPASMELSRSEAEKLIEYLRISARARDLATFAAAQTRGDLWAQEQALNLAEQDAEKLRRALAGLVSDLEALMESTDGVLDYDDDGEYHMNWERILPGGKYEYLTHWTAAKDALRETSEQQ